MPLSLSSYHGLLSVEIVDDTKLFTCSAENVGANGRGFFSRLFLFCDVFLMGVVFFFTYLKKLMFEILGNYEEVENII
ncbi:hypothetical protein F0562_002529 [Nyssa sinensis]|uniref:Uncharacterized protein n=1 Tax=Nyssa sinensis TaxID=561372 RepID=A0A5J5C611_9ASTE|nr:hypothetical protein F0562_002529 [Nyssa sinensis]